MNDVKRGEIIGKNAEIIESTNKSNIGIKGIITKETKSTITIGKKMVLKKNVSVRIMGKDIQGKLLEGRPYDRVRM